jgi:hypothetical protein
MSCSSCVLTSGRFYSALGWMRSSLDGATFEPNAAQLPQVIAAEVNDKALLDSSRGTQVATDGDLGILAVDSQFLRAWGATLKGHRSRKGLSGETPEFPVLEGSQLVYAAHDGDVSLRMVVAALLGDCSWPAFLQVERYVYSVARFNGSNNTRAIKARWRLWTALAVRWFGSHAHPLLEAFGDEEVMSTVMFGSGTYQRHVYISGDERLWGAKDCWERTVLRVRDDVLGQWSCRHWVNTMYGQCCWDESRRDRPVDRKWRVARR